MNNNVYKGEVLSFFELIKKQKIEIPIIQRDYAQGRVDKKEIRINFLNALFDSINLERPIKLDFIYGSYVNNSFQPLDGQQRLTTLFLLYWYAASKSHNLNQNNRLLLSKFSYETRITSRDFCFALVNNPIIFNSDTESVKSLIIDSNWFFLSWKKDPTIDSMLRTIDDIHLLFSKNENLWERLIAVDSPISFYYVELENIGLTDDLYIKMNARGKLLTPYENFKASFQKHIKDNKWENEIDHLNGFAYKIDTIWTDCFWKYFKKNYSIDETIMRFIAYIAMVRIAIESNLKGDERANMISNLQDNPNSVKPEIFTELGYKYLTDSFTIYDKVLNDNLNLKLTFPFWRHRVQNSFLSSVVFEDNVYSTQINSATYTQKVLLFAQTEYLKKVDFFNYQYFQDWMRVIRNIVSRGSIDKDGMRPDIIRSPQTFDGVINLIYELSDGCENIYQYLSTIGNLKSQFAKEQIEEEKIKAKLIIKKPLLKASIFEAEDNELLIGRIEFIFYCINFENIDSNFDEELFIKIKDVFNIYFNSENGLSNALRRALLTIEVNGEYEFYNYWWSYWNIVGATKRRLFDKFRELEYFIYSDYRIYFKKLVLKLVEKDLNSIAIDFIPPSNFPNWKTRLIKENDLLDKKAKSNYIAILEDNSCCYLLKSKRPRDIDGSIKIK